MMIISVRVFSALKVIFIDTGKDLECMNQRKDCCVPDPANKDKLMINPAFKVAYDKLINTPT